MLLALLLAAAVGSGAAPVDWKPLAPGLDFADVPAPVKSPIGTSLVTVVRIDPTFFELRLLSARLLGLETTLTAPEWVKRYDVTGVINASMYQQDHRTSVAFMKAPEGVNQRRWTKDNAVLAGAPADSARPPVQILDRTCDDVADLEKRYGLLIQNIRMLDCRGRNTWTQQPRKWSTACVGTDGAGRVLFIHCRSPYSTHDFIEILRALPLDLKRLMYVEGGPEASLYVSLGGAEAVSRVGSFETGFRELDDNTAFWPIPNVIAFQPKAKAR